MSCEGRGRKVSCEGGGGGGGEEEGEDSEAEAARPTHPWCHQPTYSMRGHNLAAPHREEDEDNREKDPQQILAKDIAGELVEVLVSWRRRGRRGRRYMSCSTDHITPHTHTIHPSSPFPKVWINQSMKKLREAMRMASTIR